MMRRFKVSLIAAVALLSPVAANAVIFEQALPTDPGGTVLALNASNMSASCSLTNSCSLDSIATISGGQIFSATSPFIALQPNNTQGNFLASGPATTSPSVLTFTSNISGLTFLVGSPDFYNTLTITTRGLVSEMMTYVGAAALGLNPSSSNSTQGYVQFALSPGEFINTITLASSQNAFETSNYRVGVAVPGPIAGAGLLSLFGAAGAWFMTRRRRDGVSA